MTGGTEESHSAALQGQIGEIRPRAVFSTIEKGDLRLDSNCHLCVFFFKTFSGGGEPVLVCSVPENQVENLNTTFPAASQDHY
jgi:hypothetical protein